MKQHRKIILMSALCAVFLAGCSRPATESSQPAQAVQPPAAQSSAPMPAGSEAPDGSPSDQPPTNAGAPVISSPSSSENLQHPAAPSDADGADNTADWLEEAQLLAERIVGYCFSLEDLEGFRRGEMNDLDNRMIRGFVCSFMYHNQEPADDYLHMAAPHLSEDGTQWIAECGAVTGAVARCFDLPESEIRLDEVLKDQYNRGDRCLYYPSEVGDPFFFSMVDAQAQFVSEDCIEVSFSLWSNLNDEDPDDHGNYILTFSIIQQAGESFLRFDSFLPA